MVPFNLRVWNLGILSFVTAGIGICHSIVDIVAVYLVLLACGGSLLSVCLTWIITMVMHLWICIVLLVVCWYLCVVTLYHSTYLAYT